MVLEVGNISPCIGCVLRHLCVYEARSSWPSQMNTVFGKLTLSVHKKTVKAYLVNVFITLEASMNRLQRQMLLESICYQYIGLF